ncbi:multidrug resistance protein, MATE family [Salinicoccus halodurans]|uniref:Probable multidrug resistance protein NorM n=2 Tax=Salinicoccus halodurans TaxID=407035 RepID=A0A0F7HIP7_9STAP|nr:MATE family efflux transporter [Salinicoccus halodurans]AKG72931.1 multidrug transporter MatE [Salinicoccus halodurans]SFK76302.1 multidrug resistance protein, MATE family [Salinicoccus halodurans]
MYHTDSKCEMYGQLMQILWPILVTQVLLYSMNMIDTMMSGRASVDDLAGVAIGSSFWAPVSTGINGILLAVTAIVANLMGADEKEKVHDTVMQAMYIALAIAAFVLISGFFFLDDLLGIMELEPAVHHIAYHYLVGLSTGIMPLFLFSVLRNFIDAQGLTRISLYIITLSLPLNVFFNYSLIFGNFGFPELGGIGAGYATAITYWLIFLIAVFMTFKVEVLAAFKLFRKVTGPSLDVMRYHLKIGVPIGILLFVETSIFSLMTLLIGIMFTTDIIAANQIVLNFTTMLFMLPLSISMAMTIVIGFSVGGGRYEDAGRYKMMGLITSLALISVTSILLFIFREQIAYFYTADPAVVAIAVPLFVFAIIYQVSDALQALFQGILRGYKDVTIPSFIAVFSYWFVGLTAGYLLAAYTSLEVYGFWIGISLGLTCAAAGFFIRLRSIEKRNMFINGENAQ